MELPLTGSCQCGSVSYSVSEAPLVTVACHCRDCQKLSASAFSLTMLIKADTLTVDGEKLVMFERPTDSGGSALCYFCPTCGNRVYHENPAMPGLYRLKPGGLDDPSQIQPEAHVWVSRAQPWFEFPEGTPTFETQPDIQAFLAERQQQ